ncbi:MAG TPA: Hpt domain-containing protein [Roseiarcus sp.]|nr:Hpt domain-containing protein [Roseiarcus sp.]
MGAFASTDYDSTENHKLTTSLRDARAPAIDLVHLARQSLGDQELELELLEMFERQSARIITQLTGAAANPKTVSELAHSLKGSALAVGARRVAEKAALLEALWVGPAPGAGAAEALGELASAVEEARGAIRKLIA